MPGLGELHSQEPLPSTVAKGITADSSPDLEIYCEILRQIWGILLCCPCALDEGLLCECLLSCGIGSLVPFSANIVSMSGSYQFLGMLRDL